MCHNNVQENAEMSLCKTEETFTPTEQDFHGILDTKNGRT
jgi:hypothetical protein